MNWSGKFVGLPHADLGRARPACDCYGLARVVYQEELGITLPEYLGRADIAEEGEIAALIAGRAALPMWVPVTGPALAFDLAVFRQGRIRSHIGIVVRRGLMLHMARGDCAKIEQFSDGRWAHRLSGIWRHVDLIARAAR